MHKRKIERNLNITLNKTTKTQGKEREDKKTYKNQNNIKRTNKMVISIYLLILTLNIMD